jgi:hypothetical protein
MNCKGIQDILEKFMVDRCHPPDRDFWAASFGVLFVFEIAIDSRERELASYSHIKLLPHCRRSFRLRKPSHEGILMFELGRKSTVFVVFQFPPIYSEISQNDHQLRLCAF